MNQVVTATPATTVSPKVKASAWTTLALSLLGALVAGVMGWADTLTPADLPDLGLWAVPAITLLTGVLNTLSAYLKRDPLREEVVQAVLAPVPVDEPDKLTVVNLTAPRLDDEVVDNLQKSVDYTQRPVGGPYAVNVEADPKPDTL